MLGRSLRGSMYQKGVSYWSGSIAALLLLAGSLGCLAQDPATVAVPSVSVPAVTPHAVTVPAAAPQASSPATAATLLIGAGDLLTVDVFNTPELSGKFRVGQTGLINLPQGGLVHVGGLNPVEASRAIEAELRTASIMIDPRVTVIVSEYGSQGVIVLGEVKTPGVYSLLGDTSLYGALAAAGGPTISEGSTITISHRGQALPGRRIIVSSADYSEAQHTTSIMPGDTVYVSPADRVYVLGDVGHPGVVIMPYGVHLNALQVLAQAEGVNRTAKLAKASIVRQTGEGVITIPVDLKKVMENKASDPYLQAFDVLVVPRSTGRAFLDSAIPGATAAVLGAIITALIIR